MHPCTSKPDSTRRWSSVGGIPTLERGNDNNEMGMTLVELMVTVAILGIVMVIGVPSFRGIVDRNRIAAHTNDFLSALYLARSEAIMRGRRVVLCKSNNGTACATSGNWEQGWIVFVDADGTNTVTTGDTVLRVHGQLESGDTLVGNTNVNTYISYAPSGYLLSLVGTLSVCSSSSAKNAIIINRVGRAQTDEHSATCP